MLRSIGTDARVLALTLERDGRLLGAGWASSVMGSKQFLLLHYRADGTPDSAFGTDGVATTAIGTGDSAAEAIFQLDDERRMVVGHASNGSDDDFAVARYLRSPRCGNGFVESEVGETCDDGNLFARDCCSATCQLDPVGATCAPDADPCTDDYCDGAGMCVHPAVATGCGPRLCYRGRAPDPVLPAPVALASVLHVGQSTAQNPEALCLPGSVDGAPVGDATISQEAYQLGMPRHRPRQNVRVTDRFGTLRLRMLGAESLFVPSHVSEGSPPLAPPADGAANFFECYRVRRAVGASRLTPGLQAMVVDPFTSRRYDLRRAARLCAPVAANGSTIATPAAYLLCYDVHPSAGEPRDGAPSAPVYSTNVLGLGQFAAHETRELCIPAFAAPCDTLPPCVPLGGQSADSHL